MTERPYSRYTKAKTWAALYSQHINAGYAIVPWSRTENSIDVINCRDTSKSPQEIARETQQRSEQLLQYQEDIATFYRLRQTPDLAPPILMEAQKARKLRTAVVLAKSSDYYRYRLEDMPDITLCICGLHNSYLHIPVWEIRTNHRYKPRETAVSLTDPAFEKIRRTQFGHSILLAAFAKGNPDAIALIESKDFPVRSRTRYKHEKELFQNQTYRGRPLAFRNEAEREEVSQKISQKLKEYYAKKRQEIS